jgi:hypothetical protein
MNWLLISALGFAAWVLVLWLFVAVCRAAARGDSRATAPVPASSWYEAHGRPRSDSPTTVHFPRNRTPAIRLWHISA